ncbi:MAG: hypothetical protein JWM64_1650, partial [Frankiales bacterium]|nr:hypothetical protein [Frankiales bacterium]
MSDGGTRTTSAASWAVPRVPFSTASPGATPSTASTATTASTVPTGPASSTATTVLLGLSADVVALNRAVDEALAVVPSVLLPGVAVGRAEALLRLQDRVAALALRAVADVEERELWRVRSAGSTRTWLRTLPCGDTGQLGAARLLPDRPVLAGAFEAGDV